jgi:hypothetical protein
MLGKTTVFIILDAFRWDYLNPEDTPFLWQRASAGLHVRRIVSSTGFTQRAAIFTGAYPDVTDCYTMFCYDREGSPYRFLKPLREPLRWLAAGAERFGGPLDLVERGLRHRVLYRLGRVFASHAPPGFIPLHLLPLIGVSEDRVSIHGPGAFAVPSIFDRLREKGGSYRFLMFPDLFGDDEAVFSATLASVSEGHDLYLLQFSDSDALCHLHGSEGEVRRQVTRELDRKVSVVAEAFENAYAQPSFVVIGDHGMMDVDTTVDVASAVHGRAAAAGLRHGRDYLLFLDSTLARLWLLNDRARRAALEDVFVSPPLYGRGRLIDGETAAHYRIPSPGLRYGEHIWWADPGVLIHPDYFHPRRLVVKGMHGYDSHHEKMMGFAVVTAPGYGRGVVESAALVDICPTLCDLVGIRYPDANEGESFARQLETCMSPS